MQFTTAFTIVASLASLIGTFATPVEPRFGSCNPNFAGAPQSITNKNTLTEWFVAQDASRTRVNNNAINDDKGDFLVEQNGQVNVAFQIKDAHNPNLLVTARRSGKLFLHLEKQGDTTQLFDISCDTCKLGDSVPPGTASALGCQIKNVFNGLCATATDVVGTPILLESCDNDPDQIWDFVTGK